MRLESAVIGYGKFSMEGLRLQKKFDKTLCYENKTYEQAATEVYLNKDYMFDLYLPGLLLSHYLWPHHYRQLLWFREAFIPLVQKSSAKNFYDIGVGSGFYSKIMLQSVPQIYGHGYDISEFSLQHTQQLLKAWNFENRYEAHLQDMTQNPPHELADSFMNIEVLEHLEDPISFLKALRKIVKKGAYGFITAAIDAPNRDHIYLYRDLEGISSQIEAAGFNIVEGKNFPAFEKSAENPTVPQNGSFIVQAG